jgi:hypothetical protein
MPVTTLNFHIDDKYFYLKPNANVVSFDGTSTEEINRMKAMVSHLGMKTGMFRSMFCKEFLFCSFMVIFFISFYLVLPIYINIGKAEALFCLSVVCFSLSLGFCWNYTQICKPRHLVKKNLINKLDTYMYNNQAEIYRDFTQRGWDIKTDSNTARVSVTRLKLDDSVTVIDALELGVNI